MITHRHSPLLFKLVLALMVLTNLYVLAGVSYNRWGEAESSLILTERELSTRYNGSSEGGDQLLNLRWQVLERPENDRLSYRSPQWLDEAKLRSLGFDIEGLKKRLRGKQDNWNYKSQAEDVFLVLALAGDSYQQALNRNQQQQADAEKEVKAEKNEGTGAAELQRIALRFSRQRENMSRLFVIDASLDAGSLREKYADRSRYLILKGLVNVDLNYSGIRRSNRMNADVESSDIFGLIAAIHIDQIHLPVDLQVEVADKKRYQLMLKVGQRFEPWIEAL